MARTTILWSRGYRFPGAYTCIPPDQESEKESRERIDRLAAGYVSSTPEQTETSSRGFARGTRVSYGGASWTTRSWRGKDKGVAAVNAGKQAALGMHGALALEPRARRRRAGLVEQFRLLLSRSWRQVNRAKFANMTRVRVNGKRHSGKGNYIYIYIIYSARAGWCGSTRTCGFCVTPSEIYSYSCHDVEATEYTRL